jgi:hypothetical protein
MRMRSQVGNRSPRETKVAHARLNMDLVGLRIDAEQAAIKRAR